MHDVLFQIFSRAYHCSMIFSFFIFIINIFITILVIITNYSLFFFYWGCFPGCFASLCSSVLYVSLIAGHFSLLCCSFRVSDSFFCMLVAARHLIN